jgi:hypothetical protein
MEEGQEGYAHFKLSKNGYERGVTSYVRIIKVNGEYLEFEDDMKYRIKKDKFNFIKT